MRPLGIAVLALLLLAPSAPASELVGSDWAGSPAGQLAFVAKGDERRSTLQIVSPDGQVTAAEPIAESEDPPVVAVGPRGDAIVAWTDGGRRLWARYRPPGGTLGAPELVGERAELDEDLATPLTLDASGGAILAWTRRGALRVRVRDPAAGWGPEQALGGKDVSLPQIAIASGGAALLAWRQDGPDGSQVAVSARAPGAAFGPAEILAGAGRQPSEPVAALNDRGDAGVTWVEFVDDELEVRAAFRPAGGAFGPARRVGRDGASGPSVAVLADGRAILAWRDNERHRVYGRVRSSGGALGRTQVLTTRLRLNSIPQAIAAGRGVVAWTGSRRRGNVVAVAHAGAGRRFGPARVAARAGTFVQEAALAPVPSGLAVVVNPPHALGDPIRWSRFALR